jgi:hypothetical protein
MAFYLNYLLPSSFGARVIITHLSTSSTKKLGAIAASKDGNVALERIVTNSLLGSTG